MVELNPKIKAYTSEVGDRVATPEANSSAFFRVEGGRFRNLKTGEIWGESHTVHVDKTGEWKVGSTPGKPPKPNDKIKVSRDGTIISKK